MIRPGRGCKLQLAQLSPASRRLAVPCAVKDTVGSACPPGSSSSLQHWCQHQSAASGPATGLERLCCRSGVGCYHEHIRGYINQYHKHGRSVLLGTLCGMIFGDGGRVRKSGVTNLDRRQRGQQMVMELTGGMIDYANSEETAIPAHWCQQSASSPAAAGAQIWSTFRSS